MAIIDHIHSIDTLIGRTILSRVTGNKLGQVHDLILDPIRGVMLGLGVLRPDSNLGLLDYREVYSFGKDAVMANSDDSVVPTEGSPLAAAPRAKHDIVGAQVVTEGGTLLGHVADIFIYLPEPPLAMYEVRESLLDKLLKRELFIPASLGRALSNDAERLIVPNDTAEKASDTLEALATRLLPHFIEETESTRTRDNNTETVEHHPTDDDPIRRALHQWKAERDVENP